MDRHSIYSVTSQRIIPPWPRESICLERVVSEHEERPSKMIYILKTGDTKTVVAPATPNQLPVALLPSSAAPAPFGLNGPRRVPCHT